MSFAAPRGGGVGAGCSGAARQLYLIDPDAPDPGATLERVTFSPVFDAFPMFGPDGRYPVFASNRNAREPGDTNLFIAEWMD